MEGLPRSERPPERAVVEHAMDALRDVPGLVKLQKEDSLLGQVKIVLEEEGGAAGQQQLSEAEVARYLLDDQSLVRYELEERVILVRRKSALAVPRL